MLLKEFGLEGPHCHIINGHVPVKARKGESPVKGGGKLLVIDGGFSRAYQKTSGIAGYTLLFSSRYFRIVSHQLFTICFKADGVYGGSKLDIAISGMSVKLTSDSEDEASMIVVNTDRAKGTVDVVVGISFSAVCLYTGDDVDLIPATKKAVAVAVTGIKNGTKLSYNDGTNQVEFKYSAEITAKTGVSTYVALVDAAIGMEHFINDLYYTIPGGDAAAVSFGDANGDGVLNAQDALAVVDAWLRKGEEPSDDQILTMNVNGDSRINTFDALGIVEAFVNGTEYGVVTKAATITTKQ